MQGGLIVGGVGANRLVLNGNVTAQNGPGLTSTIVAQLGLGGATRTFTMNAVAPPFPYSLTSIYAGERSQASTRTCWC